MREIRTSGLMSGAGKRDGDIRSTRAQPRLYLAAELLRGVPLPWQCFQGADAA